MQKAAEHTAAAAPRKVEIAATWRYHRTCPEPGTYVAWGKRNSLRGSFASSPLLLTVPAMFFRAIFLFALAFAGLRAADVPTDVEQRVAELTKSEQVTVVHLWAPWCPNCTTELKEHGWSDFIAANPDVKVVFVTIWAGDKGDGRGLLEKHGLTGHANFQLFSHPNTSRAKADKMTQFLGVPVTWIPTTWVYRKGTLRYALNYGEVRFPILQQLVKDAAGKW